MNPAVLIVVLGAGAGLVWFLTRDAQGRGFSQPTGSASSAYDQPNTPATIGYAGDTSIDPAKVGQAGIGSGVAVAGIFGATAALWATGIGAIAGAALLIYSLNHNDTFGARIKFAEGLGFGSDRAAYDALLDLLRSIGRADLADYALNVIGKKDAAANQAWMQEVVNALQAAINAGLWDGVPPVPKRTFWSGFGS